MREIKHFILFSPTWAMWLAQWERATSFAECYGLLHELLFLSTTVEAVAFLASLTDPANTDSCRFSPKHCVDGGSVLSLGICPHILLERKAAEVFLVIVEDVEIRKRMPADVNLAIVEALLADTPEHLGRHLNEKRVNDAVDAFLKKHGHIIVP